MVRIGRWEVRMVGRWSHGNRSVERREREGLGSGGQGAGMWRQGDGTRGGGWLENP